MRGDKQSQTLKTARSVFLRYGYKRVSMNDIAEAARVSRPALYLSFKNKEELFLGVYRQWVDETVVDIEAAMEIVATPADKIERAFEIWAVQPFELVTTLPDAHELVECSLGFAQPAQREGYEKFEAVIAPVVARLSDRLSSGQRMAPEQIAHVLSSAVRGFKQAAADPDALRKLIKDMLRLCFTP